MKKSVTRVQPCPIAFRHSISSYPSITVTSFPGSSRDIYLRTYPLSQNIHSIIRNNKNLYTNGCLLTNYLTALFHCCISFTLHTPDTILEFTLSSPQALRFLLHIVHSSPQCSHLCCQLRDFIRSQTGRAWGGNVSTFTSFHLFLQICKFSC